MLVFVIGGTGQVGSHVVSGLLARGVRPRVLVRAPNRPLPAGVEPAVGTLHDPASLEAAARGTEAMFLLTPLSETETEEGLNAIAAAKRAGVRRIVYMAVPRAQEARHIPHFASKIPVMEAVRASGIPWTILEPYNFFQNDLAMMDAILHEGVYPQPIGGVGLDRVDTRDIADAAVNALLGHGHDGKTYPVVGSDAWTGVSVAQAYARRLGRPVLYGGDDLDAWEARMKPVMPGWLIHDLRTMYAHYQQNGLQATAEDRARSEAIVGHPPRSLDDFIGEVFLPAARLEPA